MRWVEAYHAGALCAKRLWNGLGDRGAGGGGGEKAPRGCGRPVLAFSQSVALQVSTRKVKKVENFACIPPAGGCRMPTRCRTEGTASPPGAPPPPGQPGTAAEKRRALPFALWKPKPLHDTQGRHTGGPRAPPEAEGARPARGVADMPKQTKETGPHGPRSGRRRRASRRGTGPSPEGEVPRPQFLYGEFDSGSERTLAAWMRHASRAVPAK